MKERFEIDYDAKIQPHIETKNDTDQFMVFLKKYFKKGVHF